MSHPQLSIVNGTGRRRIEKDGVSRSDNLSWRQPVRTPSVPSSQGWNGVIQERLSYIHTCLVGQHVEVQKVDGHVYSGIFHAATKEKDFGVILKMAKLIKEGAQWFEGDSVKESSRKPPIRTCVIHGKDFVQIIARDVSLSGDTLANSRAQENRSELSTDAVVSQKWHREFERVLKPWKPDDDISESTGITLSNTWSSRNWDQFEANKALFGVETTYNEDLYTTKLMRGPQLREREREAQRIAREIVGQQTRNVHLAEERGVELAPDLESMDEETKYSSVGRAIEGLGDDDEDQHMDAHNNETFGGPSSVVCASKVTSDIFSIPVSGCEGFLVASAELQGSDSQYESFLERESPSMSPSARDAAGIIALDLDSSCSQVPDDVFREFNQFKQQKQLEALKALNENLKELENCSPGTRASAPPLTASKKSPVNVNAKDFKLNPNAKSFTPSSCSTRFTASLGQNLLAAHSPSYTNSITSANAAMQSSGNLHNLPQQNRYSHYNHQIASGMVAVNTSPYVPSPGGPVPGFPVGGVGVLPAQPSARIPPHSQQQAQAMTSYGLPQQAKYHSPTSALHSGLLHSNGQLFPPHMMYGQPTNPVLYVPFHQGHSAPSLVQGRLCSQPQQCESQTR